MKNVNFFFDSSCTVVDAESVGNKAHNLMKMMSQSIPVPEGFVLPAHLTFATSDVLADAQVRAKAVVRFAADNAGFDWSNESELPYLVSVRSGSAVSMPGMMDTILNVGLNNHNVRTLSKMLGDTPESQRFSLDCYRRLIQMYGTTVCGHNAEPYIEINGMAKEYFLIEDVEMMRVVVDSYLKAFKKQQGHDFPQDVDEQLTGAIRAVFNSWHSERAIAYREHMNIQNDIGTAVTVQGMRFGNMNENSCTGVVFSRDPNTGEYGAYGDFLINAQGEDVVAGTHNTLPIHDMAKLMPTQFDKLEKILAQLDHENEAAVDVEFTVQDGELWILQCRKAKLNSHAALRSLLERVQVYHNDEHIVDEVFQHIMLMINNAKPSEAVASKGRLVATGQGVSTGVVSGILCCDKASADDAAKSGASYIFVANDTTPDDTVQMIGAKGILTKNGSSTCHAAVVARAWDMPAVVGCSDLGFSADHIKGNGVYFKGEFVQAGTSITINGSTGEVFVNE